MKEKRRTFDASFKLQVAQMIRDQCRAGVPRVEPGGNGASPMAGVIRCRTECSGSHRQAADGRTTAQSRQLETENRQLRQDNDLLKHASSFFARELK